MDGSRLQDISILDVHRLALQQTEQEFKGRTHEKAFQVFFAEQHLAWDLTVCLVGWIQWVPVMINLWRNRLIRSPLWHATFITLYSAEKMMPTAMILFFSKFYTRHRTLLLGVTRLLEMFSTDAYLSFWMDYSDKGSCFEWSLLASVFANNWISAAHWGFLQPLPNQWWIALQVADMARVFLRQSTSMRQMEAGLHLMTPLTGVVNAIAARFGAGSISEQDLLFCCWMLLEVVGGFLVPLWLTHKMQLSSRRQWRQGILKRLPSGSAASHPPYQDRGLDIRPTWALFLPESLTFLTLFFIAGQDPQLLYHMV